MKLLVLGDTHFPFTDRVALAAAISFAKSYKPDHIIQVGDFIDGYNWSLFKRAPDSPSAEMEWNQTELMAHQFFEQLAKFQITVLEGNHCRRYMLRACEANLPRKLVKTLSELFPYENVHWHMEPEPFVLDGIAFIHGDEMAGNVVQKARALGMPLVQGHTHQASLTYINTFKHQIFGMEVGALIDGKSIACRYAAKNPLKMWSGVATITDGIPSLRPIR